MQWPAAVTSKPSVSQIAESDMCWKKPEGELVKFNSDGSFVSFNCAGIGIVARNCSGQILDGFADTVIAFSPLVAEAAALLKACQMAVALNLSEAAFEVDWKELFEAFMGVDPKPFWRCDALFADITSLFQDHPLLSLKLIPKQANLVADFIAKLAARKMCPIGWVSSPHLRWPLSSLLILVVVVLLLVLGLVLVDFLFLVVCFVSFRFVFGPCLLFFFWASALLMIFYSGKKKKVHNR